MSETERPVEWLWWGEDEFGQDHISFGRWQNHPCQHRYKLARIQPTEHDHLEAMMHLLDDVPGDTLMERVIKLKRWYLELQLHCAALSEALERIRDFPYVGAKASAEIIQIAQQGLAALSGKPGAEAGRPALSQEVPVVPPGWVVQRAQRTGRPVDWNNTQSYRKEPTDPIQVFPANYRTSIVTVCLDAPSQEVPAPQCAREADMVRLLAELFSESVHETWTTGEIVSVIKDAIRLGSSHSRPERCTPHE